MIERLQIKNFQCHESLKIKLDPKITAIVGPSDVGKSAILRAIRWVATNRPRGDSFIKEDADEAQVTVWTDNGKVCRRKGSENTYAQAHSTWVMITLHHSTIRLSGSTLQPVK
jgi:exonuclease SbcC